MMGTKEIKELVSFGAAVATLVEGLANGFELSDLTQAVRTAQLAPAALKDAHLAWSEYLDLDDAEAGDLDSYVQSVFKLENVSVELFIEKALAVVVSVRELVKLVAPKA